MPNDDALLALRPEIEKAAKELQAARDKPGRSGTRTRQKFDEPIARAIAMPNARTPAGVEFQATAKWLAQSRGIGPGQGVEA